LSHTKRRAVSGSRADQQNRALENGAMGLGAFAPSVWGAGGRLAPAFAPLPLRCAGGCAPRSPLAGSQCGLDGMPHRCHAAAKTTL
jgi:hypothetical protein